MGTIGNNSNDNKNKLVTLEQLCPDGSGLKRLRNILDSPKTLLACSNSHYVCRVPSYYGYNSCDSASSSASSSSSTPIEPINGNSSNSSSNSCLLPAMAVDVDLKTLIVSIRDALKRQTGISVSEIRLGGGAASRIICNNGDTANKNNNKTYHDMFNDIDFIFTLGGEIAENQLHSIRSVVIQCFRNLAVPTSHSSSFVSKTVKVWNDKDRWTLISLGASPLNVDLIFVSKMARNYQFSVDSFQLVIDDTLLTTADGKQLDCCHVPVESAFGDIGKAVAHVNGKLLATNAPETIRGGGLLRYCDLLSKGFKSATGQEFDPKLEQIMCTRFFIDFPNIGAQAKEMERYLRNHFQPADHRKCVMLRHLMDVIQRSSHCIMNQERRLVLSCTASFISRENALLMAIHSPIAHCRTV